MKGDFTRFTFDPRKHYSGVRMQQGRVLLDSDWNEQADIFDHRSEMQARDIIGRSGCPADDAGFGIVTNIGDLTSEEQNRLTEEDKEKIEHFGPGNFLITAGRYYVDGILCENEQALMYTEQRHEPKPLALKSSETGEISIPFFPYVVYLDVWKRHVSVIEDSEIRETALGGPDTTTRIETAWQVRVFKPEIELPINSCIDVSEYIPILSNGRLTVGPTSPAATKASKCSMAPKGGYRGLENRLYRVEIHDSGRPFGWPKFIGSEENTGVCRFDYPTLSDDKRDNGKNDLIVVEEKSPDGLSWRQGQMVEIFVPGTEKGTLARIEEVKDADGEKTQLKLNLDISKLGLPENLRIHRVATFKWSKDNGSVCYSIEISPDQPKRVKVKSLGRDKFLSLRGGDCVETLGDGTEFRCEPGTMALISENGADEVNRELILDKDVSRHKDENNIKIRRWEKSNSSRSPEDMVSPITLDQAELEDGIVIQFSVGPRNKYEELPSTIFRSGDYWTFAARSKEGKLKELKEAPPEGIEHHYASLARTHAINDVIGEGSSDTILDCRRRFRSSRDMFNLYYLGGDGQDGWPGQRLAYPLMVGVAMGRWPVADARVIFSVVSGGGNIEPQEIAYAESEEEKAGIYCAIWTLGRSYPQVAKAVLYDTQNNPIGTPIYFSANLNLAEFVEYIPPEECNKMSGIHDVQSAINSLCPANILYYLGGDGQIGLPGRLLPIKLQVGVADSRGPVSDASVKFIASGGGKTEPNGVTKTKGGIAECNWILGTDGRQMQQVVAYLVDFAGVPIVGSLPVHFYANLNRLAELRHVSSENQEVVLDPAKPGQTIQVKVQAVNDCGPVMGASVLFYAPIGRADPIDSGTTDKNGIASCNWSLSSDADNLVQILTATLDESEDYPIHRQKNTVTFKAKLNIARNILYAVSGNGQVGVPGQTLTLRAGVADSRGPVPGVPVQFKVLTGDSLIQTIPVSVDTGKDGVASWNWKLGKSLPQQVEASLLDTDKKTVGLPVEFNAILNAADCILYDPKSFPFMQSYNTVQEALDQLCSDQSDFNITEVAVLAEDGQSLRALDNGAIVRADLLVQGGLTISCSENVDPTSFRVGDLRTPACILLIEEPYFLSRTESFVGYNQLVLLGDATVFRRTPSKINWMPSRVDLLNALNFYCSALAESKMDRGLLLVHLVIKGNFIRSAANPNKYLDGDSFAIQSIASGTPSRKVYPSGNGRAGGDFEMWFWVSAPMSLSIAPISDIKLGASATMRGKGTVNMNMAAPIDMTINLLGTCDNTNITLSIDKSIIIKKDQNAGDFYFIIQKGTATSGLTNVTINAALARWSRIGASIIVKVSI